MPLGLTASPRVEHSGLKLHTREGPLFGGPSFRVALVTELGASSAQFGEPTSEVGSHHQASCLLRMLSPRVTDPDLPEAIRHLTGP